MPWSRPASSSIAPSFRIRAVSARLGKPKMGRDYGRPMSHVLFVFHQTTIQQAVVVSRLVVALKHRLHSLGQLINGPRMMGLSAFRAFAITKAIDTLQLLIQRLLYSKLSRSSCHQHRGYIWLSSTTGHRPLEHSPLRGRWPLQELAKNRLFLHQI